MSRSTRGEYDDHALIFHFSEHGSSGIDLRNVAGDFNNLAGLANFQRHIQAAELVQFENNAVLLERGESALFHRDFIFADLHLIEEVEPIRTD